MSELVELRRFERLIQGELARTYLESYGLHPLVFDSGLNTSEGGGLASSVRLMIVDEEFDEARQLLKDYR